MRRIAVVLLVAVGFAGAQSAAVARMLEQAGQFERAYEEYERVLGEDSRDMPAYEGFRRLGVRLEYYERVLERSRQLAVTDTSRQEFVLGQVEALFGLGRDREALARARTVARRWPAQALPLVQALEYWDQVGPAAEFLSQARAAQSDPFIYSDRLITLYERQGKTREALRVVVELVNRTPDVVQAYLANIREYVGSAKLRVVLAELGGINDGSARARARAEAVLAAGREAEAVREVEGALSHHQLRMFAEDGERGGWLDAALAVYEQLGFRSEQGRVLRKLGRTDDAIRLLSQERGVRAQLELAEIQRLVKRDFEAAAKAYRTVLERDPSSAPGRYGLAAALVGAGKLEGASAVLDGFEQMNDQTLLLATKVLFYLKDVDSARAMALGFARRFPRSPLLDEALGLVLLASGERGGQLGDVLYAIDRGETELAGKISRDLAAGDDPVAEQAYLLQARVARMEGDPNRALALLDMFDSGYPGSARAARAWYEAALILRDDLHDETRHRAMLERILEERPGSAYAPVARSLVADLDRPGADGPVH